VGTAHHAHEADDLHAETVLFPSMTISRRQLVGVDWPWRRVGDLEVGMVGFSRPGAQEGVICVPMGGRI
jgi:hypothetical protein